MINNPQVYITEVGLFDEAGELMAIGRLSSALEKNFSSEAIIKVRLTY